MIFFYILKSKNTEWYLTSDENFVSENREMIDCSFRIKPENLSFDYVEKLFWGYVNSL